MPEPTVKTSFISSVSPRVNNAFSKIGQSIPKPVNQFIQQGVNQVQKETPKIKNEVIAYAQSYQPSLTHLIFLGYFLAIFLRQVLPFSLTCFYLLVGLPAG